MARLLQSPPLLAIAAEAMRIGCACFARVTPRTGCAAMLRFLRPVAFACWACRSWWRRDLPLRAKQCQSHE